MRLSKQETNSVNVITTFPVQIDTTFSKELFINYLNQTNIKYPEIVYAQAILETGNFSSKLFRNNNNLFGMKKIGNRPTASKGSKDGYAYFETWKKSVLDYAIYQSLYLKNKSKEEYYNYLSTVYATDSTYITKIKLIELEYNDIKKNNNR